MTQDHWLLEVERGIDTRIPTQASAEVDDHQVESPDEQEWDEGHDQRHGDDGKVLIGPRKDHLLNSAR